MKRFLACLVVFLALCSGARLFGGEARGPRLFLEPGVAELPGDGDATTTVSITLRDAMGEIVDRPGTVILRLNAGTLSESRLRLRHGFGQVVFRAPILDNENKVFQRSIRLTMAIIQRLSGKPAPELTGKNGRKTAIRVATETARAMPPAAGMTTIRGRNPEVHIIAEMDGLKGRCSIRIKKVDEDTGGVLRPGIYQGRDVTGSSSWELRLKRGGPGWRGTLQTSDGGMLLQTKGEKKAGFLIIYLSDEADARALSGSGIKYLGMPSAMKVLPGNALYIVAPPLFLTRRGDLPTKTSGRPPRPEAPKPTVSLVARRNILPGDGSSETELSFVYRDSRGRPRSGIPVHLKLSRGQMGGKLIRAAGRTDSHGVFRCRYRAPVFKTEKLQELGTCRKDTVWAYYREGKKEGYTTTTVGILRCTEARLLVDKPGFEGGKGSPIIIASPRGRVSGTILARVRKPSGMYDVSDVPIGYATVRIVGGAIRGHESVFVAETDARGRLQMELKYRNWPVYYSHQLKAPFIYPFNTLHRKRRDALAKNLFMFPDTSFRNRAGQQIYTMELGMVADPRDQAEALEAKFQLLGDLMASYWMSEKLVEDTTSEVISHGWSLLGMVWDWASKKYSFSKKVQGLAVEGSIAKEVFRLDQGATKSMRLIIFRKLNSIITRNQKSKWGKAAVVAMAHANSKIFGALKQLLGSLADELAKRTGTKWPANPVADEIQRQVLFHFRRTIMGHLEEYLAANPQRVLEAFPKVHPWLVANSGNLGRYYQNIAWRRMVVEEAKAWKDLAVDLSQGLAIGVAVGTGQVWALNWWDKFKKFSDLLDKAYSGSAFIGELYVCSSLIAESTELFIHTNRLIDDTGVPVAYQGASLIPVAFAAEGGESGLEAPPTVFSIDPDELELKGGRVPLGAIRRLAGSYSRFVSWEERADGIWLLGLNSRETRRFVEALDAYTESLETAALMAALAGDTEVGASERKRWEETLGKMKRQGKLLDRYAPSAYQQGLRGQRLASSDDGPSGVVELASSRLILIVLGAFFILLAVAGAAIIVRRRRRGRPAPVSSPGPGETPAPGARLILPGGASFTLLRDTPVGSAPDNAVVLSSPGVRPYHAMLRRAEDGRWWIESRDAAIPVLVNGAAGPSFWLESGSRIVLGPVEIVFLGTQDHDGAGAPADSAQWNPGSQEPT